MVATLRSSAESTAEKYSSRSDPQRALSTRSRITPAALAALLLAKVTIAAERGTLLEVTDDSRLDHPGPDPRALVTIVGNLIDNALDAVAVSTPPRRVTVRLTYDDDAHVIVVCVSDSGPGVSRELAERVFHDGYATKRSRDGRPRGLGLALVHRLVSQLGGHIEVTVGPGATFTATLPVVAAQVAPDQPTVSSQTP